MVGSSSRLIPTSRSLPFTKLRDRRNYRLRLLGKPFAVVRHASSSANLTYVLSGAGDACLRAARRDAACKPASNTTL